MKLPFLFSLVLMLWSSLWGIAQEREVNERIALVEKSLSGNIKPVDGRGWTIQERMAHYNVNGVSIAVIHNYKLEWTKGYGWANAASKIPVTENTRFQAGSVSKSVNAFGVLKLVQQGNIDLNADINDYLTSWKFPYDSVADGRVITMKELLSHTAGLNVQGFRGYQRGERIPTTLQILEGTDPANSSAVRSLFAPGVRHEYAGGGITISQLIIEDLSRQAYDHYMEDQILKPLGMLNSSFASPDKQSSNIPRAMGYYESGEPVEGGFHIYPEMAAAGLWTTPSDLAKYIIALQQAYRGTRNTILNTDFAKLMLTPFIDQRAALGVFIDNYAGEMYFEHDGLTYGYYCQYYGSLNDGNGVVVMTNSANTALIPEIINSVAKVYGFKGLDRSKTRKNISIDDKILQGYTGNYALGPDMILTVLMEHKQLYIRLTGQDKVALFPESESKFFMKDIDAQLDFVKDEKGKVTKVVLYQDGGIYQAPRLDSNHQ
ncbi:serine hydrolase [Parapedobacter lycopersici]|uniref:serine hydrolase n=1 Tax=Parapedobacter lycopersici TaxID=1864939 RepID=UPI00214D9D57|nr:serine hydrolase [Parapedobacter lycopersici]